MAARHCASAVARGGEDESKRAKLTIYLRDYCLARVPRDSRGHYIKINSLMLQGPRVEVGLGWWCGVRPTVGKRI